MTTDSFSQLPARSRPVHQPVMDHGNKPVLVFLTVCTAGRRPILATPKMHTVLRQTWQGATTWLVGRYVVMPDHLHLFCAPGTNQSGSLRSWVACWKRSVAFAAGGSFWQKNFWDTQLRGHESYAAKWDYVRSNPVRTGLIAKPDDWPYQGEMNILRWHD